jgi:hypothetical protein
MMRKLQVLDAVRQQVLGSSFAIVHDFDCNEFGLIIDLRVPSKNSSFRICFTPAEMRDEHVLELIERRTEGAILSLRSGMT